MIGDNSSIHLVPEALPAFAQSRAGIIASGTATVEAAIMGTPFVMVYRVSPLTYRVGRPRVKVPHFAMVNLIAGEEIVPELVQQDFTAEKIVTKLNEIIADGPARNKMAAGLDGVRIRLRGPGEDEPHAVDRAARRFCASGRGRNVKNWLNLVLPASFGTQSSSYGLS